MTRTLFPLMVVLPLLTYAQTDPPLVASGTYDNDVYKWTFVVGDLAIQTFQTSVHYWSQGSVQPVVGTVSASETEIPDLSVILYPNPTEDVLILSLSAGLEIGDLDLDITDVTGRTVYTHSKPVKNLETTELSLSVLPAGAYFLRLTDHPEGRRIVHAFQKL